MHLIAHQVEDSDYYAILCNRIKMMENRFIFFFYLITMMISLHTIKLTPSRALPFFLHLSLCYCRFSALVVVFYSRQIVCLFIMLCSHQVYCPSVYVCVSMPYVYVRGKVFGVHMVELSVFHRQYVIYTVYTAKRKGESERCVSLTSTMEDS